MLKTVGQSSIIVQAGENIRREESVISLSTISGGWTSSVNVGKKPTNAVLTSVPNVSKKIDNSSSIKKVKST